jgi:hypothetical protein
MDVRRYAGMPVDSEGRGGEGRIGRGWRLTLAAWSLMRRDRTMIYLALLGAVCGIAGAGLILWAGGYFSAAPGSRTPLGLVSLVALYPLSFVGVFINVALATAAGAHLEGRQLTLGDALRAAYERIGRVALWALLAAGVGMLISEIAERIPGGAKLIGWLMGTAWGLATIFAVPLMALEDARPIEALRGSAHLVKSRWGEGLAGMVGITAWTVVVALPAGILIGLGAGVSVANPGLGIPLLALGATVLVAVVALATATRQVFAVALYRYATDLPVAGFAGSDLEQPFSLRKRRRTRKIAWIALGLIVALFVVAALSNPGGSPRRGSEGYSYVTFTRGSTTEAAIRDGMPVVFRGRRVGHVVEHRLEGSEVFVVFFVDPARRGIRDTGPTELNVDRPAHPYLRLLPE